METENKTISISVTDAAEILGINVVTVRGMINRGELPAARTGKVFRIKRSDLDALFQRHNTVEQNK